MIKIESLKDYIGKISNEDFAILVKKIYDITDFICEDYPHHKQWYFNKQVPRVFTPNGEILFARAEGNEDQIIAVACLKKDEIEKKICTLYVSPRFRGQHLGTKMIEESMKFLETTKPLVTIADYKLPMFQAIIDKYDWQLVEIVTGLYRKDEFCYNGRLTQEFSSQEPLVKRRKKITNHNFNFC